MTTAENFRKDAERYRKLAEAEANPMLRDQLLGYARQYEAWAMVLEDDAASPPPASGPIQPQPMQQQQQQKKEGEE